MCGSRRVSKGEVDPDSVAGGAVRVPGLVEVEHRDGRRAPRHGRVHAAASMLVALR